MASRHTLPSFCSKCNFVGDIYEIFNLITAFLLDSYVVNIRVAHLGSFQRLILATAWVFARILKIFGMACTNKVAATKTLADVLILSF